MPIYTFVCDDGHDQEVLCKLSERDTLQDICDVCGKPNVYSGRPELIQRRDFGKGAYRMKAITSTGEKRALASGGTRGDS